MNQILKKKKEKKKLAPSTDHLPNAVIMGYFYIDNGERVANTTISKNIIEVSMPPTSNVKETTNLCILGLSVPQPLVSSKPMLGHEGHFSCPYY